MTLLAITGRLLLLGLLAVGGCGFVQSGTPGHEPPTAGRYNPVSGEVNGP